MQKRFLGKRLERKHVNYPRTLTVSLADRLSQAARENPQRHIETLEYVLREQYCFREHRRRMSKHHEQNA